MGVLFVGEVEVHDPERYDTYAKAVAPLIVEAGGKVLTKGGKVQALEGAAPAQRVVIVYFETREALDSVLNSETYRRAKEIRLQSSTARTYVVETTSS